jgi:hypothetical protein
MARFVVGDDRSQSTLFPERLDDYLGEDNPVRAIDVFVDELVAFEAIGMNFIELNPIVHNALLKEVLATSTDTRSARIGLRRTGNGIWVRARLRRVCNGSRQGSAIFWCRAISIHGRKYVTS